ncbi:MAG TPA: hypothetical protein VMW41_04485 [Candidatus Bathyarchaeia archaeon]|nr:hypothetical protein [Candidatus Bathyarchaeia archaeon]
MNQFKNHFVEALKKFPFGEKFLEHSGLFVVIIFVIWIALMVIMLIGEAREIEFRQIKSWSGIFLILFIASFLAFFIFNLLTKYG